MAHSTRPRPSRGDTPTRAETFPGLHTRANYCSLINQHILINHTHTHLHSLITCAWMLMCPGAVVWICLGDGRAAPVENAYACPRLLGLHHVGGMFAERILCADRTPRNRRAAPHTRAFIAKSLASRYKAHPPRGEGPRWAAHKAPSVTQNSGTGWILRSV